MLGLNRLARESVLRTQIPVSELAKVKSEKHTSFAHIRHRPIGIRDGGHAKRECRQEKDREKYGQTEDRQGDLFLSPLLAGRRRLLVGKGRISRT